MFKIEIIESNLHFESGFNIHDNTCAICKENLNDADENDIMINKCNHGFHKECISVWLTKKKKCPTCNSQWYTKLHHNQ